MKKNDFKLLSLLTVFLLVISACSSKEKTKELVWYNIGTPTKDNDKINEALNKYLTDNNKGYTVKMNYIDWGDYENKMQIMNNSGEYYDIAFTANWAGPYLSLASKGAFLDIEELIKSDAPNTYKSITQDALEVARVKDGVYAVPASLGAVNIKIMFNEDLVKKYNIPYQDINTLAELKPWFDKIAPLEPEYDMLQIGADFGIPQTNDIILWPLAVPLSDESRTVVNFLETTEMKENLKLMREFYVAKHVNQDAAITKEVKTKKFFTNIAEGSASADAIWSRMYKQPIVSTPITPSPYATTQGTTGTMLAISSSSKNSKEAMQFIELINSDEYVQNLLSFGIEGTHYELKDGAVSELPDMDNYRVPLFTLGSGELRYLTTADAPNLKELEADYKASMIPASTLGFSFDASSVQSEVANIKNVVDEFKSSLLTGSVDPDVHLKNMNDKLKAAGIDKVKEEMQKQVDEWQKNLK